jgi:hypothetical protein
MASDRRADTFPSIRLYATKTIPFFLTLLSFNTTGHLFLGTTEGQFEFGVLLCANLADAISSSNKNATKHYWEAATPRWRKP